MEFLGRGLRRFQGRQIADQIGKLLLSHLPFEPLGHQRDVGRLLPIDVGGLDANELSVAAHDADRVGRRFLDDPLEAGRRIWCG